ncbi:uncharacterized protein LOC123011407 [Tribolium madens]|uniref:uncharacterized protein LOC123011407 n=1 Tax=Tribolium madens TaxID=41895 RepID=UPI001CF72FEC|nr:uncharacterized protein LOC123011407 [Tribolium madens]
MLHLTIVPLVIMAHLIHGFPKTVETELPNYPRQVHSRGFNQKSPSPFTSQVEYEDTRPSATQEQPANYPFVYQNAIPVKQKVQQVVRGNRNGPQQFANQKDGLREKNPKQLEEEEIEEPDRLSLLLPNSKFVCDGKNTGYYADEDLGCEVFHYCQDNAKHSWICPEGFTFHQVHLICMPPGGDNICEKSSQFHFVNDYLYKPVNLEEYQQKPNVSLRYSERFYPENYYQERENDQENRQPNHHRNSVRVQQEEPEQVHRPTFRPEPSLSQVFRSPNEVNIPLQQRRPQYLTQRFFSQK